METTIRKAPSPRGEITLYRLVNARGCAVELSTLGAGITEVSVPDREGRIANVALSYADPASYIADGPCMGKVPGRYANRIALGKFHIDGEAFQLAVNNGPNALHGGPEGFQNRIWEAEQLPDGVRFTYRAKDGEEHYPGNLTAVAEYRWSDDNVLTLTLSAVADKPTVVNLTNHCYWNLDGADNGSALGHTMTMKCSRYLPTDDTLIPTGELAPVEGTPMDFRATKVVGRDIREDFPALRYGKGYDACWVVDGWEPGKLTEDIVELRAEGSGRVLRVSSDQPGAHVYTGNWLAGCPENRSGRSYEDYDGIAVEMQGFPDAPNHADFPTQTLRPGEEYRRTIRFAFTAE